MDVAGIRTPGRPILRRAAERVALRVLDPCPAVAAIGVLLAAAVRSGRPPSSWLICPSWASPSPVAASLALALARLDRDAERAGHLLAHRLLALLQRVDRPLLGLGRRRVMCRPAMRWPNRASPDRPGSTRPAPCPSDRRIAASSRRARAAWPAAAGRPSRAVRASASGLPARCRAVLLGGRLPLDHVLGRTHLLLALAALLRGLLAVARVGFGGPSVGPASAPTAPASAAPPPSASLGGVAHLLRQLVKSWLLSVRVCGS